LATAAAEALTLARAEIVKAGIADPVLDAVDEPGYWKPGSPERLAWDLKVARASGWPVYCTSTYTPQDRLGQGLEYHCYSGSVLTGDPRLAADIARQTRDAGQKLWYYCTGSYSGQIGNMLQNRYLAGIMFDRTGADGTASWTFQRPTGNAFDDFRAGPNGQRTDGQPCITYPDPEHPGQNLDTPTWEGLRQAFYDHQYVATLRQVLARAKASKTAGASAAEQRFERLLATLPWNGDPFADRRLSNTRLDEMRASLAEMIVALSPVGSRP
jgi:hypothetical protein